MGQFIDDKELKCNILLLGKKGSGKSSFAKYLRKEEVFTSKSGKTINTSEIPLNIYDSSVDLESSNYKKWSNKAKTLEDIHIIFYTVNATLGKLEDWEIAMLKRLKGKNDICIIAVLTKCDIAEATQIENLKKHLKKEDIKTIETICIVDNHTQQKGKEEAISLITDASYAIVGREFANLVLDDMERILEKKRKKIKKMIEKSDISIFGLIKNEIRYKYNRIKDRYFNTFTYNDGDIYDQIIDIVEEADVDFEFDIFDVKRKFQKYIDFLEYFRTNFKNIYTRHAIDEYLEGYLSNGGCPPNTIDTCLIGTLDDLIIRIEIWKGSFFQEAVIKGVSAKKLLKKMTDEILDVHIKRIEMAREIIDYERKENKC